MAEVADKPSETEQNEKIENSEEKSTKSEDRAEDKPATNGNAASDQTDPTELEKKIIHQIEVLYFHPFYFLQSFCVSEDRF